MRFRTGDGRTFKTRESAIKHANRVFAKSGAIISVEQKMRVTTFDVCASGMERLRNNDEFILLAYITSETTAPELLEQWLSDIDSCDRGDGFDFEAARETVSEYHESNIVPLFSKSNPFNLDPPQDEDEESCVAFLYIEVQS